MAKHEVDRLVDTMGVPKAAASCGVASVLFTYRCSIACKHCLFGCGMERPDVVMTPDECAEALALLHETGRVVHIAGGEPMLYWDALRESVRLSFRQGVAPHFLETNCSFAASDQVVRDRFVFLKEHGVRGLYASADPFHQQFVPSERFLRVRRLAKEIFGPENFYGLENSDAEIRSLEDVARDEARLGEYVRSHPPVMVGTARSQLTRHLESYRPDDARLPAPAWRGAGDRNTCLNQFRAETMWELHIDPYGNLQTNCGIVLGNVREISPAELFARGPEKANRFVQTVSEAGPLGLAELARREHGFELPERVTQTCELCYLVRRFLRGFHPDVFGPAEVYA